jgi:putative ABC transport system permease protein
LSEKGKRARFYRLAPLGHKQLAAERSKCGLALTFVGLVMGLALAATAARSTTSLLYGFRPDYFPTVTAASVILLAVAVLASLVPARRASRMDPVIALRRE